MTKAQMIGDFLEDLETEVDFEIINNLDDLDNIHSYDDILDQLRDNNAFEEEVIYYANAMKILVERDPSLQESLGIASEMGFDCGNLNSEILASLLATRENEEDFYKLEGEITEFFDRLAEYYTFDTYGNVNEVCDDCYDEFPTEDMTSSMGQRFCPDCLKKSDEVNDN